MHTRNILIFNDGKIRCEIMEMTCVNWKMCCMSIMCRTKVEGIVLEMELMASAVVKSTADASPIDITSLC